MTNSDKNNFSKAVRKALIDKGWSVKRFAQLINRPPESVSRAIRGHRFPVLQAQIAKKLSLEAPAQL